MDRTDALFKEAIDDIANYDRCKCTSAVQIIYDLTARKKPEKYIRLVLCMIARCSETGEGTEIFGPLLGRVPKNLTQYRFCLRKKIKRLFKKQTKLAAAGALAMKALYLEEKESLKAMHFENEKLRLAKYKEDKKAADNEYYKKRAAFYDGTGGGVIPRYVEFPKFRSLSFNNYVDGAYQAPYITLMAAASTRDVPVPIRTKAIIEECLFSEERQELQQAIDKYSTDDMVWKIPTALKDQEKETLLAVFASPITFDRLCYVLDVRNLKSSWAPYREYFGGDQYKRFEFSLNATAAARDPRALQLGNLQCTAKTLAERIVVHEGIVREKKGTVAEEFKTDSGFQKKFKNKEEFLRYIKARYASEIWRRRPAALSLPSSIESIEMELLFDFGCDLLLNYMKEGYRYRLLVADFLSTEYASKRKSFKEFVMFGAVTRELGVQVVISPRLSQLMWLTYLAATIPNDFAVSVQATDVFKTLLLARKSVLGEIFAFDETLPSAEEIIFGVIMGSRAAMEMLLKDAKLMHVIMDVYTKEFYRISLLRCASLFDVKLNSLFWAEGQPDAFNMFAPIEKHIRNMLDVLTEHFDTTPIEKPTMMSREFWDGLDLSQRNYILRGIYGVAFRAVTNAGNWMEDKANEKAARKAGVDFAVFFPSNQLIFDLLPERVLAVWKDVVMTMHPWEIGDKTTDPVDFTKAMMRKFGFTRGRQYAGFDMTANKADNAERFILTHDNILVNSIFRSKEPMMIMLKEMLLKFTSYADY